MNVEDLRTLIAKAEFHKFLKVELASCDADRGRLTLKLPFDSAYTIFADAGTYHGGIVASLVDIAGAMACTLIKGHATPTANLRVDYLKTPARTDLYADGIAQRVGRSIGVADVEVRDSAGTIFALGRGTFVTTDPNPPLFADR